MARSTRSVADGQRPRRDFWIFLAAQSVSAFGNAVTLFAIPLIVFKLTHSAVNLALTSATQYLPWLIFGLFIGAWLDRTDRKRLMILTELGRAAVIASVPLLGALGHLSVAWLYLVAFTNTTLAVVFEAGQFAAIPSLVSSDDLVTANGRQQASYQAAMVAGPVVGGALLLVMPVEELLLLDALSLACSAASLLVIRTRFSAGGSPNRRSVRADVADGVRYVFGHPLLRSISIMMLLINFFASNILAQLVLLAKVRMGAADSQVAYLFAAGSVGSVLLTLAAGPLRRRLSFGVVALGALCVEGASAIGLSVAPYWLALPLCGLCMGGMILFNVNTFSLRQAVVPAGLLSRVITVAGVTAWSVIPLGALAGGFAVQRAGPAPVYAAVGAAVVVIACAFGLTPIGHAERYLPDRSEAAAGPEPVATGDGS